MNHDCDKQQIYNNLKFYEKFYEKKENITL